VEVTAGQGRAPRLTRPRAEGDRQVGLKFGFSFSWKRALGISSAKSRLSRMIGIPLTRSGRERKLGRMATGGGCALIMGAGIVAAALLAAGIAVAAHIALVRF